MESGRPIRIARRPGAVVRIPRPSRPGATPGYRANHGGTQRAVRLFTMYLAALLLVYAVLLVGLSGAPGGLGGNGGLIVAQGLIGLGIAIAGWTVTLGQAPRGVWVGENSLVVRERLGREREFPAPAEGGVVVVRRYAAGWLSNEPAAIVRLKDASGLPRVYLVGDTLIPPAAPG